MKKKIALLAVLAFAFISCDSAKKSTENMDSDSSISSEISNVKWELTTLESKEIDQSDMGGKKIHFTLNAVDQTISGYSGCNTFNGNYTLENGGRIKFSRLATTRMACLDDTFNESELLKVFELADNFTIQNDMLSLNIGRRAPLAVFKKVNSENDIVEKYWKLKTLEGKDVTMAENQEREIFFTLKTQDNRVTGFAGCNSISGEYTLEKGNRINFKNMATTLRACPDYDGNETDFLQVFNLADNYTINGDILSLNVGKRAPLAVFEVVYMN